jgi:hypothetical protein
VKSLISHHSAFLLIFPGDLDEISELNKSLNFYLLQIPATSKLLFGDNILVKDLAFWPSPA